MVEVDTRLKKLPTLGEVPKLGDPTKGFINGKKSKSKCRSKKCRSRSRSGNRTKRR